MKYQRLSQAELEELKDDFIRFLASQGIDAKMWQDLKAGALDKAEQLIDIYSDLVYDQALNNCEYLEQVSAKEFKAIWFGDDKAELIWLRVRKGSDICLNTSSFYSDVLYGLESKEVDIYRATKQYNNIREQEMFNWIKKGAYMADGGWFKEMRRWILDGKSY